MLQNIWIIGANSDIAKAYLKLLDTQSNSGLACMLYSRDAEALEGIARSVKFLKTDCRKLDLANDSDIKLLLNEESLPDAIVFASGVLERCSNGEKRNINQVFSANAMGAIKILDNILPKLAERGGGLVVGLSSIAGERGKADNPIYCSSKAAFTVYLEGVMQKYNRHNVSIVLLKLGFVQTKMLAASGKTPPNFLITKPEYIAKTINTAVLNRKSKIIFVPWIWNVIMWLYCKIPLSFYKNMGRG